MNILFFLTPKKDVDMVYKNDSLGQAAERFEKHGFTSLPIIDPENGKYTGTLSEGDILRQIKRHENSFFHDEEEKSIMCIQRKCDYQAVTADSDIEELFHMAVNQNFVPVVDDTGIFIGIITRKTILNSLIDSYYMSQNK